MSYGTNALAFLVDVAFDFLITLLMLRVLLQIVKANFFNPVCQFLVRLTNPVLAPVRRFIPMWGRVDLGALAVIIILKVIQIYLSFGLAGRTPFAFPGVFVLGIADLVDLTIMIFFVAIIVKVILSWVAPAAPSPVTPLLYQLTEPVLSPFRQLLPAVSGFDLSPLLTAVALQLAKFLIVAPLVDLARTLA